MRSRRDSSQCATGARAPAPATNTNEEPALLSGRCLPKTPVLVPTVYQDGNLLSYDASCADCVLQIVEDDVVVYSEILSDTQQTTLPTFLSGIYEVQIIQGNYYYYGDITL